METAQEYCQTSFHVSMPNLHTSYVVPTVPIGDMDGDLVIFSICFLVGTCQPIYHFVSVSMPVHLTQLALCQSSGTKSVHCSLFMSHDEKIGTVPR